jgi:flagellar motor switch protein FliM
MADPNDGMSEEERMAAEWAAMAENAPAADAAAPADTATDSAAEEALADMEAGTTRVLNQDEIDSLLGFDGGTEGNQQSGIMALVNSALVNYERLPMLEVVFDRLVRVMSTSLRNFTSDNVDVTIDSISSVRFGDYMNSIPLPAMLGVFKAEEWDNYGLLVIDSTMIYSIVDVLLGGRRGTAAMRIEGRPYTTIERNLVERMIHVIMADLSAAFDPLSPVTFRFDRLETNPRFAALTRPSNAAVLVRLRVDMEDRGGRLEIVIPYATLEPVRELLLQMFMGEKFGRDSIWETHLGDELMGTDIDVTAVLHETTIPLTDVLAWKPGSQVIFNMTAEDSVSLRCGEIPLFEGRLGQAGGHIAVRIEKEAPKMSTEDIEE